MAKILLIFISPLIGLAVSAMAALLYYLYINSAPLNEAFSLFKMATYYYLMLYLVLLIICIPVYYFVLKMFKPSFFHFQLCSLISFGIFGVFLISIIHGISNILILRQVDYLFLCLSLMSGSIVTGLIYWGARVQQGVKA